MRKVLMYPDTGKVKLEFDKILNLLLDTAKSKYSKNLINRISALNDINYIHKALLQTLELKELIEQGKTPYTDESIDIDEYLQYLKIEGSVLSLEDLFNIRRFLRLTNDVYIFLETNKEVIPSIFLLIKNQGFDVVPYQLLLKFLNDECEIPNGVSKELDEIRWEISKKEKEIYKKFNELKKQYAKEGILEKGEESFVNGKRVLMVASEYKRKIKGVITDESATGKTTYIEPELTLELNNELFELRQQLKREIYKIQKQLTDALRPYLDSFIFYQKTVGILDFIKTKAFLAISMKATMPQLVDKELKSIELIKAYNPLLYLINNNLGKSTIPISFRLDEKNRILLISGPNAGGKSVALKTLGLMQLMVQSGLLVPCHSDSVFCVFNKIFVELGDEQSIENELSTFSSRLMHLKFFIQKSDKDTLILIDEFGSGTDPQFGGAIAEAVLEQLLKQKVFGMINTHFGNLKKMATEREGIINGAMLFERKTFSPLYSLSLGQPGSSYAFEIATKMGLPNFIIKNARNKLDRSSSKMDEVLGNIETDKIIISQRKHKIEKDSEYLKSLIETYQKLKDDLELNRKNVELEARRKSNEYVAKVKAGMDKLFREYKKELQEKNIETLKELSKEAIEIEDEVKLEYKELRDLKKGITSKDVLQVGDVVKMIDTAQSGIIENIHNKKATVIFGNVRTHISLDELEKSDNNDTSRKNEKVSIDFASIQEEFKTQLDVKGKRVDEALNDLDKYLDKVMLLGIYSFRILHGTGEGILRRAIRTHLKGYKFIRSIHSAPYEDGGEGITVVEIE